MKIAIVHDDLMRRGGGEQVALSFHNAFPEAPLYTLCYQPDLTYPEFRNCNIITSSFQKKVKTEEKMKKLFFPWGLLAMSKLKLEGFDVVLMSTTFCAKYVNISSGTLVITYCHNPFRLAWQPETYQEVLKGNIFKKAAYAMVIKILKIIDRRSTRKIDFFLTNASHVADRIRKAYHVKNEIRVINPPVKTKNFFINNSKKDYYLVVSRFEPYKKVDLVIEAFNILQKKIIIVGKGSLESELKLKATSNILFKSGVSKEELAQLYSGCRAFIFPQLEDYGITPLEANAAGRPVIAYGEGGVLETMIPFESIEKPFTALFFQDQQVNSLVDAVKRFEEIEDSVDPEFIRSNAEKFNEQTFISKIKATVEELSGKSVNHN